MVTPTTRQISQDKAREWWAYFRTYPGFADLWSSQGWGTTQIAPLAQKILNAVSPPPPIKGQQTALIIPVADRDWAARWVRSADILITHGALWACQSSLAIFDFAHERLLSYPYDAFAKVARSVDDILLATVPGHLPIHISLRVPRPSPATPQVGFVLDVVQILASDSIADRELVQQRGHREADEYHQKLRNADQFVESVHNFFSLIAPSGLDTLDAQPKDLLWPTAAPSSPTLHSQARPKSGGALWIAAAVAVATCGSCLFVALIGWFLGLK